MQMQEDNAVEFAPAEYQHDTSVSQGHHRTRRSPLDPVIAPLLIGKSFLYGALVGPKLFKPYLYPRYNHYHYPIHHYPRYHYGGYGHHGHHGLHGYGYGYGR